MVYNFFDRKSSGSGVKSQMMSKQELAEELHKPFMRGFEEEKVYSSSKDIIRGADLAGMQLI